MNNDQTLAAKELLDEGNTPHFIVNYRKELVGDDVKVEEVRELMMAATREEEMNKPNDKEIHKLLSDLQTIINGAKQ
jgi:transcriptional accessory protein Tex/SPT6